MDLLICVKIREDMACFQERWRPYVYDYGFYDPVKSGSIDGIVNFDNPPHDRAVCRAQAAKYRPSEAAFPERVFKLWKADEDIANVSINLNVN